MSFLIRITCLASFIILFGLRESGAKEYQRILKGTVYQSGKPAKGVKVTVDRSKSSYFTSFDGKYEVKADKKSKWIMFSFPDKEAKINLDPNGSDYIDYGVPSVDRETAPAKTTEKVP